MADVIFQITGDKNLAAKFRELPGKVQKQLLRSSLRVAAKPLLAKTKENAPVESGALQKSLKLRAIKRSRKNKDKVGVRVSTNASDNLFKGETYYGGFYEFGTKRQPPRPFMKQAATESESAVKDAFRDDFRQRLNEIANELRNSG